VPGVILHIIRISFKFVLFHHNDDSYILIDNGSESDLQLGKLRLQIGIMCNDNNKYFKKDQIGLTIQTKLLFLLL